MIRVEIVKKMPHWSGWVPALDKYVGDGRAYTATLHEVQWRGLSDGEWESMQDKKNLYYLGDIVSFKVGGMGIITGVSTPHPRSYSCTKITGKPFHRGGKCAWHLVGDFKKLLYPSGIRSILCSHS